METLVSGAMERSAVTVLVGSGQAGKSTMAREILKNAGDAVYLDLRRPSDLNKLDDAAWFLTSQKEKLICIDEIERKPELLPVVFKLAAEWQQPGKFLVLGAASGKLIRQHADPPAGSISCHKLTPFLWTEIPPKTPIKTYLYRGGYLRSLRSASDKQSLIWREDFITTFLERDLLLLHGFAPATMRRLLQMLAHVNGEPVNYAVLGNSLGVSSVTVKNYVDLLEAAFMLEVVRPFHSNKNKRMAKAPRVYIADQGITTALLQLKSFNELYVHPVIGSIWEQVVLSNLKGHFPAAEFFFYKSSGGAKADLVMKYGGKTFAIDCTTGKSPKPSKGFYSALEDIQPDHTFIVAPVKEGWPVDSSTDVVNLRELIHAIP